MNAFNAAGIAAAAIVVITVCAGARVPDPTHAQPAPAPDLFDQSLVRDFRVQFADADWLEQLERTGESGDVRADLEVDGVAYPGVGLRYKGLSSSRVAGPKKPFNLTVDAFTPGQRLYGFDTVNLNNSYGDPSHVREVLTNDLLRSLVPAPRGAYVKLHLNGDYWGLYILSEQIDKTFTDEWFRGSDGLTVKADSPTFGEQIPPRLGGVAAAGAPVQGGFGHQSDLTWRGEDIAPYVQNYEVKTVAVGDAGYEALRELTRALDAPVTSGGISDSELEARLPEVLDVDSALWYLAATNALMNYDSYYFGHNYFLHQSEHDLRWYVLLWDTSLSLGVFNIAGGGKPGLIQTSPFIQLADPSRPLVRRLLAVPRWRADYLAHFRTVRTEALDAGVVEARGRALQDLIRPALTADNNWLYALDFFERNLDEDVSLGPGAIIVSNGEIPGIVPLVRDRATWLDSQPDMAPPDYELVSHTRTPDRPGHNVGPRVVALFSGGDVPAAAELVYRIDGGAPRTLAMTRTSDSWSVDLTGMAGGTRVSYYIHTTLADGRTAFHPASNWLQPWGYRVTVPDLPEIPASDLVLNELQADNATTVPDEAGEYDDWTELLNRGAAPIDLAGYYLGETADDPWEYALPPSVLQPGARILVWCDNDAVQGPLHAPFKLSREGGELLLSTSAAIADRVAFTALAQDSSFARIPDAVGGWQDCAEPSPRAV